MGFLCMPGFQILYLWCLFLVLSMDTAHSTSMCSSGYLSGCNCSQMPLSECNLDKCVQDEALFLSGCELSGTIPPAIGEQKFLQLDLSYNQLTGTIPSFLEASIAQPTLSFFGSGINQPTMQTLYGCASVCHICMLFFALLLNPHQTR